MNEQSRNVHENKGSLWKTCDESANVYEKKAVSPTTRECWSKEKGLCGGCGWMFHVKQSRRNPLAQPLQKL